jgi:hypothetical protein
MNVVRSGALMSWRRRANDAASGGNESGANETAELYPWPAPLNAAIGSLYRAEATIAATVGLRFGLSLAPMVARPSVSRAGR